MDGTPHPQAWSRLCDIGRFKNWDQARSWAVRIEWQYPANSGKWRSRYLTTGGVHGGFLFAPVPGFQDTPGAFRKYANSIAFLQWLFGSVPAHNHIWIHKYFGRARVLQAEYDLMQQSIRFVTPTKLLRMIDGAPKSDDGIEAEMRDPKYKLDNVGGTGHPAGTKQSSRTKCDTCTLTPIGTGNTRTQLNKGSCIAIGDGTQCTNCRTFGPPYCSWTDGVMQLGRGDESNRAPEALANNEIWRNALFFRGTASIPETLQDFDHNLRILESSGMDEDDTEDAEFRDIEPVHAPEDEGDD